VAQKTAPNRSQILKEIARSFGLNPDEILTREALEKPHRTVIGTGIETLKALKHKLKEELTAQTARQLKTVQIKRKNGSPGEISGFYPEPFELPSAGFFSLDENQSPLCLDGVCSSLSTTLGGAVSSSTGLLAPGQTTPSLCGRYKSFILFERF